MTEAVYGMIQWAKKQPEIKAIIASTNKSNAASFAVLVKNNFIQVGETEALLNWRLSLKNCEFSNCEGISK
jgi:RimJ/RimL family protein N-acetyltransferase